VNTVNIVDFVAVTASLTTIYGDDITAVATVRAIKIIPADIDVSLKVISYSYMHDMSHARHSPDKK